MKIYVKQSIVETNKYSFIKALIYRFYQSFFITPLVLFLMTGNINLSLTFGAIEFFVKIPAYYIFERIWIKIKHYKVIV